MNAATDPVRAGGSTAKYGKGFIALDKSADSLRERRAATKNTYDAGARHVVNRLTLPKSAGAAPP